MPALSNNGSGEKASKFGGLEILTTSQIDWTLREGGEA